MLESAQNERIARENEISSTAKNATSNNFSSKERNITSEKKETLDEISPTVLKPEEAKKNLDSKDEDKNRKTTDLLDRKRSGPPLEPVRNGVRLELK